MLALNASGIVESKGKENRKERTETHIILQATGNTTFIVQYTYTTFLFQANQTPREQQRIHQTSGHHGKRIPMQARVFPGSGLAQTSGFEAG